MTARKHLHVVAAVIEWNGKILCMQRGATKHDYTSFHWEFPGGKIELGETPQQALHRELIEEMELDVEVGEHIATVNHSYPDFDITLMFYRCIPVAHCADGNQPPAFVRLEHNDHRWLTPDQLHTLSWCPADFPVIDTLCQQ